MNPSLTAPLLNVIALGAISIPTLAAPVSSAFTWQGRLGDAGQPANGAYDFQFSLCDALTGGATTAPAAVVVEDVAVQNGLFTVTLDFGEDAFSEGARWIETGVRRGAETSAFTLLSPRQAVTAAPIAIHALDATQALTAQTAATATSATRAASADSVMWSHVTALPGGFADGVDNDTTYMAGPGLTLGAGNQFALNFSGNGTLNTVARSDHSHFGSVWSGSTAGTALTLSNTAADGLGGLVKQGTGSGFVPIGGVTGGLWADAHDGPALLATSPNAGGAVIGQNTGTGVLATGVSGVCDATTGRGVYGHATFTGAAFGASYGVVGECESSAGAGVKAVGANTGSPALEIQNGGIKVSGAGVNSPTTVFIHEATAAGQIAPDEYDWGIAYKGTVIDHPLCNNHPNAMLIVTPRADGTSYSWDWRGGDLHVDYDSQSGRWSIRVTRDLTPDGSFGWITPGARFNVLVVNP